MTATDDTLAQSLARFAAQLRYQDLPGEAVSRARDAILDCLGCQLLGSADDIAGKLLEVIPTSIHSTAQMPVALVGRRLFAGRADAALYGGTVAHALDFDDTNHPGYAHPTAVILPALMAVADLCEATGRDMIVAYVSGLEVFGKLGRALNTEHYKAGWHPTKSFGVIASALACARVMGLSADQTATAVCIAVSQAGGMRVNFGTMVKPLHAGQAAQAGVMSALLARTGFTASTRALEDRYGYLDLMGSEVGLARQWLTRPGEPLEILEPEAIALKPYPSCGATHPAIEAAIRLHGKVAGRRITAVTVGAAQLSFAPLIHSRPGTGAEAKFSMEYCVAHALVYGAVSVASFSAERLSCPELRSMIERTSHVVDERVADSLEFAAVVSVTLEGGEQLSEQVDLAAGKPARWLSSDEIGRKFVSCASAVLSISDSQMLLDRLRGWNLDAPALQLAMLMDMQGQGRQVA